ncbi:FAD-dependent oxidoreductase [Anoxynatronum sibiricum]|uniref:FAD-dependent oxidoreductase n=1 Tax=Anoxynatronum sibiricum TaxID=210623 RepID=A0ABU9VXU8_9CLOT
MIKLSDFLPMFTKHQLFLKEKYKESGDIYTFVFETRNEIFWKAGQHGIFTIKHKRIRKPTRAFSIASAPSEGHIKISMHITSHPSEFKKVLFDFEPGMSLIMRGPIGSLYIHNQIPHLFIAGGIGITPYRPMIIELASQMEPLSYVNHLIHMDSKQDFLYRKEVEDIIQNSSLTIAYPTERENMLHEIQTFVSTHGNNADYYLVGPKSMVTAIETALKKGGVKRIHIKKDVFIGY